MEHRVKLESLSWFEAERWFATNPVVVMPLGAEGADRLTDQRGQGLWLRSGVFGQATLANADKGSIIAEPLLQHCLQSIDACGVDH